MKKIIDVAQDVSPFVDSLVKNDVGTVIRYYNNSNSTNLPTKRLQLSEANILSDAGINLAVVFQQRGGANGHIEDLTAKTGDRDAKRALSLAAALGQPQQSAIYFAVDHDYFTNSELQQITPYFSAVKQVLNGKYRVGCYGSGTVCRTMQSAGLIDLVWLAGATGWSGTKDMLKNGGWTLFQRDLHKVWPGGSFSYDGNTFNPAFQNFGQFSLAANQAGAAGANENSPAVHTIMTITATGALNLRKGPGTEFDIDKSLPGGTMVTGLGREGNWVKVDVDGNGTADGFMHGSFLEVVSGGFPIATMAGSRPIDIARAELALDIAEVPGSGNNPRIVLYHQSTGGGAANDSVAWCSSFVNYCVEQAGLEGTNSKWAMSWHDKSWGQDVTTAPMDGDIVVFRRRAGSASGNIEGGHVAFWLEDLGSTVRILGGNQSNKVKISTYPKNGMLGQFHYEVLSIRRP